MSRIQITSNRFSDVFVRHNNDAKCSSLDQLSNMVYNNCHKKDDVELTNQDDSLTSLNWLNNINIAIPISNVIAEDGLSQRRFVPDHTPADQHKLNIVNNTLLQHFPAKLQSALRSEGLFDTFIRYEYKTSWTSKPPFSYTTLICMAMLELQKPKIALYEIYEWIRHNFLFYRISDSSWQNSVRHNLSLKKCFEKVPRRKDERGKGGFWRINANYTDNLGTNLIKYRRQFQMYASPHQLPYQNLSSNSNSVATATRMADDFAAFSKRYTSLSNATVNPKPAIKTPNVHLKPVFKKPQTLSSLNQFQTFDENDNVIAQMRLHDSADLHSPTLCSLTYESMFPDISSSDSVYSNFGLDDFDSTTSSSFDTDFSCNSNFHSSSDDSYRFQLPLDLDDFLPSF